MLDGVCQLQEDCHRRPLFELRRQRRLIRDGGQLTQFPLTVGSRRGMKE